MQQEPLTDWRVAWYAFALALALIALDAGAPPVVLVAAGVLAVGVLGTVELLPGGSR